MTCSMAFNDNLLDKREGDRKLDIPANPGDYLLMYSTPDDDGACLLHPFSYFFKHYTEMFDHTITAEWKLASANTFPAEYDAIITGWLTNKYFLGTETLAHLATFM